MAPRPSDDPLADETLTDEPITDGPLTDDPLSDDPLHDRFGDVEVIEDELLASAADVPLIEPMPSHALPASASKTLTRALWFLGIVVTAMLVLQTAHFFLPTTSTFEDASRRPAPAHVTPPTSPLSPALATAEKVDRALRDARIQLSRQLYEDVLRVVEPLAESPGLLNANQRFEAYLLLARSHRALGNVDKAQSWSLRAMDQSVERQEPSQVLDFATTLSKDGRHEEARRQLCQLLARADGLTVKDQPWRDLAEARLGDAWYEQAQASGHLAPLPGGSTPAAEVER